MCVCPVPAQQADRLANLLKGSPVKKGFKVAHAPPRPVSMFIDIPWEPSSTAKPGSTLTADKSKWMDGAGKDFDAVGNKQRSAVAKPGFSNATTAALHDKLPL